MQDIIIVGGGLSGLALLRELHGSGLKAALYEARERFGGRILSYGSYDVGPTWIWPDQQPRIARLTQSLKLKLFPQYFAGFSLYQAGLHAAPQRFMDNATYAHARRLEGGMLRLIDALLDTLPSTSMNLNHRLMSLADKGDHVAVCFDCEGQALWIPAKQVVIALPPRLLSQSVQFQPALGAELQARMQRTPTWMAGQAKAIIRYPHAFWRASNLSGSAFANYTGAILGELFDASDRDAKQPALGGFFALPPALRQRYRGDLETLITAQLTTLFGPDAARPLEILIHEWTTDVFTATREDEAPLTQHPNYGDRCFQLDHWNDKLYFCGTETAKQFGGYLEGALEAAERTAKHLLMGRQTPFNLLDTGS